MVREPNLGMTVACNVCGKSFWCEDGNFTCSLACEQAITCECGEYKEAKDLYCSSCCDYCPNCGEDKQPSEDYCRECSELF